MEIKNYARALRDAFWTGTNEGLYQAYLEAWNKNKNGRVHEYSTFDNFLKGYIVRSEWTKIREEQTFQILENLLLESLDNPETFPTKLRKIRESSDFSTRYPDGINTLYKLDPPNVHEENQSDANSTPEPNKSTRMPAPQVHEGNQPEANSTPEPNKSNRRTIYLFAVITFMAIAISAYLLLFEAFGSSALRSADDEAALANEIAQKPLKFLQATGGSNVCWATNDDYKTIHQDVRNFPLGILSNAQTKHVSCDYDFEKYFETLSDDDFTPLNTSLASQCASGDLAICEEWAELYRKEADNPKRFIVSAFISRWACVEHQYAPSCLELAKQIDLGKGLHESVVHANKIYAYACRHGEPNGCVPLLDNIRNQRTRSYSPFADYEDPIFYNYIDVNSDWPFDRYSLITGYIVSCNAQAATACRTLYALHQFGELGLEQIGIFYDPKQSTLIKYAELGCQLRDVRSCGFLFEASLMLDPLNHHFWELHNWVCEKSDFQICSNPQNYSAVDASYDPANISEILGRLLVYKMWQDATGFWGYSEAIGWLHFLKHHYPETIDQGCSDFTKCI